MAGRKISNLTEKLAVVDDDVVVIVDSEVSSGDVESNKKVKVSTLKDTLGGNSTIPNDIPVILENGDNLGPYKNGDTIPCAGATLEQFATLIAQTFLVPTVSSFVMKETNNASIPTTVEVGTTLSGIKKFDWSITNSANILANSIEIIDVTGSNTVLGSGIANDGSENLNIGTIQKTTEASNVFRINATDLQSNVATRTHTINWAYKQWYGAISTTPTDSAGIKSLPSSRYNNSSNVFNLITGTTETIFVIAVPINKTLLSVLDVESSNADITSSYVNVGVIGVEDADGSESNYNVYILTAGIPYSSSHTHKITLN